MLMMITTMAGLIMKMVMMTVYCGGDVYVNDVDGVTDDNMIFQDVSFFLTMVVYSGGGGGDDDDDDDDDDDNGGCEGTNGGVTKALYLSKIQSHFFKTVACASCILNFVHFPFL